MHFETLSNAANRKLPQLAGNFVDLDDCRYALVKGKQYPVLLKECLKKRYYEEDVSDPAEFSQEWCRKFVADIQHCGHIVLVDIYGANDWRPVGLYQAWGVRGGNLLSCMLGDKIARLSFP